MRVVLFVVAVAAVAVPTGVWAAHQFSDVPDTHPFHDEVSAVAGAGVTTGFPDGTFRPGNNITRQAAAAFFERGLGRVASAQPPDVNLGSQSGLSRIAQIASVGLDAGAAGGGNGFVHLQADFMAYVYSTYASSCPCDVEFWLARDGTAFGDWHYLGLQGATGNMGYLLEQGGMNVTVPLPADTSAAYQLYARLLDTDVGRVGVSGHLTATYVPFGPDGDNTLAYEHTCTSAESESNDTQSTADSMPSGGCVRGRLSPHTDVDFYAMGVSSGQTLHAETKSWEGAGCNGHTRLDVLDFSGTTVATDFTSGVGPCSRLAVPGLSTGTYFLKVTSAGAAVLDYRLEASVSSSAGDAPAAKGDDPPAADDGASRDRLAPAETDAQG